MGIEGRERHEQGRRSNNSKDETELRNILRETEFVQPMKRQRNLPMVPSPQSLLVFQYSSCSRCLYIRY